MNLEEYKNNALRTESIVETLTASPELLAETFKAFIAISEILDGIKKLVYYGKGTKLEGSFQARLDDLANASAKLRSLYVTGAYKRSDKVLEHVNPRLFHGIIGITTEAGELASVLLNNLTNPEVRVDSVNVQEEMNDINWYQAILHDALDLDWEQGMKNNIEKLRVRFPDKFTQENAEVRNLDLERTKLEMGGSTCEITSDGTINMQAAKINGTLGGKVCE